jgi:hypothetical protein
MAIDINRLDQQVQAADIINLSDADAATLLSVPIFTPRTSPVTYTTLGDAWNPLDAGAFIVALNAAISSGNSLAIYVDKLLSGPGFDATNPKTIPTAALLVQAGLCTQNQVDVVLNIISYRCGDVVQTSDVTASRARLARNLTLLALQRRINSVVDTFNLTMRSAGANASLTLPIYEDFITSAQNG